MPKTVLHLPFTNIQMFKHSDTHIPKHIKGSTSSTLFMNIQGFKWSHKQISNIYTNIKGPTFEHSNHRMYKYQRVDIKQTSNIQIREYINIKGSTSDSCLSYPSPLQKYLNVQTFKCSNIQIYKYQRVDIRQPPLISISPPLPPSLPSS